MASRGAERHVTGEPVVVLGAGLAGVCTALALSRRGRRVTIIDQAPDCLLRASLRNEGKIHLGLVYANDPSARTAHLMLEAALRFDRVVEESRRRPGGLGRASVVRLSLCGPPRVAAHAARAAGRIRAPSDPPRSAHARRVPHVPRHPPVCSVVAAAEESAAREWLGPGVSTGVVATAELALDLARFCQLLRAALESAEGVEHRWRHRVDGAERTAGGYRLRGRTAAGEPWSMRAAVVVNCLWEDRMRLDAQLGFLPRRPWVHRLKYRVLGRLPRGAPGPSLLHARPGTVRRHRHLALRPRLPVLVPGLPAGMVLGADGAGELAARLRWERWSLGRARHQHGSPLRELDRVVPGLGATTIDTVDAGHHHRVGRHGHRRSRQRAPRASRGGAVGLRGVDLGRHREADDGAVVRAAGGGPGGRGRGVIPPEPPRLTIGIPRHRSRPFVDVVSGNLEAVDRPGVARPSRGLARPLTWGHSARAHGVGRLHRGPAHPGARPALLSGAPVPLGPDPTTGTLDPMSGNPGVGRLVRDRIRPRDPHVSAPWSAPAPVSRHPHVRRPWRRGDDLRLRGRGWRRLLDDGRLLHGARG